MSDRKLVKLDFGSNPVHFGKVGIGIEETSERVSSDGLFSAWMSIYARLFGKQGVEELLDRFLNDSPPPVRMSSTFVYSKKADSEIFYLPKPLQFPCGYPDQDLEFFKTYKSLRYLPLDVWMRWYQGQGFTDRDREELSARAKKEKSENETSENEKSASQTPGQTLTKAGLFDYNASFQEHKLPKIAIDRRTAATNLFHAGFVHFHHQQKENNHKQKSKKNKQESQKIEERAGLYFILDFPQGDRELEQKLHAALQLLGEEGIGGRRSSGAGRFTFEWQNLPKDFVRLFDFVQTSTHYCLLSLYWDDPGLNWQEITRDSSYEMEQRRGWLSGSPSGLNLRRQSVTMFLEGSLFKQPPQGKLADVTPPDFQYYRNQHRVYRNGIALSLPVRIKPNS
ncbi:type III-A CRISPR-associated RAMP protein Csm4 [Oxynema sp. CENA135]|uniref:type III-A CRISPR-associated RAMP protein Csm4 n=1 Tax=Oxynema sp. CENA135 TaxID=984206 RepID=UPI00190BB666|nr:type III-A CRISPR-associated RAMP protein Csm4 [Oxynema sp. CENA135]MBK4730300.1 type III-A CRISPR-associated RAMP protein Csm4 [Oxynema sp. CENA135]